ncbi:MAG: DUF6273 domain-containing protein [Treponema sp.]|nr:DUF6273 domain-containing protein [Treponema sp.]
MKKNTFIHGIFTMCTAGLFALLFSAGCSGLSADILRGGTDTETGGTQTAGKTVSVSFDCTDGVRMVLPSPALTGYTYTVTGTVSGGSAEPLLTGKTYAEVTASGAVTVDPGSWTFTVTAYSKSSQVLAGSVTADLTSGAETLPVTLYAVTGGTGSVSVTLNYPHGKGVTKVTAALYDSPVEAGSGAGQTITTGTDTDSVTFTEANVPSATAKFVRFFLYDGQGACLGLYTDSVYVVAGLASTATDTLSDINMFGVTVNILKDGSAWVGSGKVITLKKDSLSYDLTNASGSNATTGSVPYGTYEVYADGTDTGGTLTAETDGSAQADVDYYTVTLQTITGYTITAQSGSESPVLRGGSYSFTITLSEGYTDSTVSVTANGSTLTSAADGVYTVSGITAAQTVAVTGNVYAVTLDNQSATTAGTGEIYEKYGDGFYLESGCTTEMSGTANGITVPVKSGYAFGGYYTATGGSGTQYVGAAGKLTENADTELFTAAGTLYAKWTLNDVTSLTASTGDSEVTLSWTNPDAADFSKAVVTWTTTADTGTQLGTKDVSGTGGAAGTYTVTGLTNGTSYTFTVKAFDTSNNASSGMTVTQYPMYGMTETPITLAAGTDGTAGTGGTYVEFGDWPQTIKASGVTIVDETNTASNGYYVGSDGYYYAKVSAAPCESDYTFSDETTITSCSTYYFKVEPIKWRVLDASDTSKELVVAESILTNVCYYGTPSNRSLNSSTIYANNYKYSNIRVYLNGTKNQFVTDGGTATTYDVDWSDKGFLQTAFTSTARAKIQTTTVDNSADSTSCDGTDGTSSTYVCDDTNDKIFLLSEAEAVNTSYGYASSSTYDSVRRKKVCDYARATGAYMYTSSGDYQYCGWWWLRSPYYFDSCYGVRGGSCYGNANGIGGVCTADVGVAPALLLLLE